MPDVGATPVRLTSLGVAGAGGYNRPGAQVPRRVSQPSASTGWLARLRQMQGGARRGPMGARGASAEDLVRSQGVVPRALAAAGADYQDRLARAQEAARGAGVEAGIAGLSLGQLGLKGGAKVPGRAAAAPSPAGVPGFETEVTEPYNEWERETMPTTIDEIDEETGKPTGRKTEIAPPEIQPTTLPDTYLGQVKRWREQLNRLMGVQGTLLPDTWLGQNDRLLEQYYGALQPQGAAAGGGGYGGYWPWGYGGGGGGRGNSPWWLGLVNWRI